ncbi:glycosyltransferase family 39 protein [Kiloniella sp.]|uniref:glycosyltransferase family 39 protein n=1 Tax=Kiloniella sp. TaxID=1938587 RepID=UPI003B02D73B
MTVINSMTLKTDIVDHSSWKICLAASIIPLILGAFTLFEPFSRDQGIHATIASALQDGLSTYRDVYNIKPPMTTATHWLALEVFGHSVYSIRYLDMLFVMFGMACLSIAILRLGGSKALAIGAAAGFSSLFYSLTYWEHAQTDEWAAICLIISLLLLSLAWRHPDNHQRFLLIFYAGAVMGIAFTYKYTIAGGGILIFAPMLTSDKSTKFFWRDLMWFVLGGLTFLAIIVSFLASTNTLMPFLEIQEFIKGYVEYSRNNLRVALVAIAIVLSYSQLNATLVLFGTGMLIAGMVKKGASLLHVVTIMLIAAGWLSGFVQGKGFAYHFIPILIGYAILFGLATEAILLSIKLRTQIAINGFTTWLILMVSLVLMTSAFEKNFKGIKEVIFNVPLQVRLEEYDVDRDFNYPETLKFSNTLSKIRKPDETMFIWGYETALYFLQNTSPEYRYPYTWPFSVDFYDERYTKDLLDRLKKSPPKYFIVQKKDGTPWVTGHKLDSREILPKHPEIHNFLLNHYKSILETDRFDLWENRPN